MVQLSHSYMTDYWKQSSVLLLILSGVKSTHLSAEKVTVNCDFSCHVVSIGPLLFFLMPSHLYKTGSAFQVCVKEPEAGLSYGAPKG